MSEGKGLKERIEYNEDFKLDWHDPDEATDGYQLKWIGKDYARLQSGTATETMIIPDNEHNLKEENKNSQNLFFTGDNLEVLKHLQNAYSNSIKMIYIDPPYNTGNEFIYNDTFEFSDEKLKDMLGMTDDEIKRLHTINGRSSHSAWLTFMYPRLKIAKKLLTEDGVIFISIDDNEQANLKLLCDEIFGESNLVGQISRATGTTTGQDANKLGSSFDYLLFYKNSEKFELDGISLSEEDLERFTEVDEKGEYSCLQLRKTGNADRREDRPNMYYPVISPEGNEIYPIGPSGYESRWRVGFNKYQELLNDNYIIWKHNRNGQLVPYVKYYADGRTKQVPNLWNDIDGNKKGSLELKKIFNFKVFDNPKPISLLNRCLNISKTEQSTILDFFAGSATTAHAVMQLDAEDGGNRKFIMVQLDEPTKEDSEAKRKGYDTIDEISRKRIELAGQKIKKETNADIDYGFKHYYVKDVDIQTINKIEEFNPEANFIGNEDMIREFDNDKSKGEDVILTTWLVDDGYKLDIKVEIKDFKGYKAYYVDNSALYLLSQDWGTEQTKELLEQVGNNKFNLNTIILYGYSFNFESIKELQTNIKQNIDRTINVEKRY